MGRNIVSRKISISVGQYAPRELFYLWTKVHPIFSTNVEGIVVKRVFSDVR